MIIRGLKTNPLFKEKGLSDILEKGDHPRIISIKFVLILLSGFRKHKIVKS
jgi:hypothetical protein